jgi:hypothetical protein
MASRQRSVPISLSSRFQMRALTHGLFTSVTPDPFFSHLRSLSPSPNIKRTLPHAQFCPVSAFVSFFLLRRTCPLRAVCVCGNGGMAKGGKAGHACANACSIFSLHVHIIVRIFFLSFFPFSCAFPSLPYPLPLGLIGPHGCAEPPAPPAPPLPPPPPWAGTVRGTWLGLAIIMRTCERDA